MVVLMQSYQMKTIPEESRESKLLKGRLPLVGLSLPLTPPDSPSSEDEVEKSGPASAWRQLTQEVPNGLSFIEKGDSSLGSEFTRDSPKDRGSPREGIDESGGVLIDPERSYASALEDEAQCLTPATFERGKPSSSSLGLSDVAVVPVTQNGSREGRVPSDPNAFRPRSRGGFPATVCVMQQKGGAPPPQDNSSYSHCPMTAANEAPAMGCPPLRSVLKRMGQRSRGHRVSINEAKNEVVEADYVILVRDEDEPQLVSIRAFDLALNSGEGDQVTLSPPEGYKDVFGHAIRDTIICDEQDNESGGADPATRWACEVHDPDCPRANLPDLITSPRCPAQGLTVENVRHHDQLMLDDPREAGDEIKVAKTGILKGGKLWKNSLEGGVKSSQNAEAVERGEEPRRSVRFSGRDEFTTLEAVAAFEKVPFDVANQAALACFLSPKFQELSALLGEQHGDWHVDLSPLALENAMEVMDNGIAHHHTCAKHLHKMDGPPMNDEHIGESVQRYDEMRRRIAVAEGRDNNSICSDESKSSSDSQSSDSMSTETRIRRLENADAGHGSSGIIRSNSEVRRAIERNALRRSLIRLTEVRKKDTNKNDKNKKPDTSLLEQLKWLTASEDATNGNDDEDKTPDENDEEEDQNGPLRLIIQKSEEMRRDGGPKSQCTIEKYRRLAEMFNRTTSYRVSDVTVPSDVPEWKLEPELYSGEDGMGGLDMDDLPPGTMTFTAVPAVSVCEQVSDEESDKLIYSGGVRYTKEGTLPPAENSMANGTITITRDRPHGSNAESYTENDIDEVLHDDRSSSVPSSSQSSPRLSGRSDMDGVSTAESGYSSNETNSELGHMLPPELDELAEFVKQDAARIDRVRRRFDDPEDHGFNRRPSVRGIKPRFGSTTDLLKQMANQLAPPPMTQPSISGAHVTWLYRDAIEEENGAAQCQRRRSAPMRNNPLPALQEEVSFLTNGDDGYLPSQPSNIASVDGHDTCPYSNSGNDHDASPPRQLGQRELQNEFLRQGNPHMRFQNYSSSSQFGSSQSLIVPPPASVQQSMSSDLHHPSCTSRRPASIHGHAPTDMLVSGPQHPTPILREQHGHPHSYRPRSQCQPHEDPGQSVNENSHLPLGPRGSYPGTGGSGPYTHHSNLYHNNYQSQTSPIESEPTIPHSASNNCMNQRVSAGHNYDRAAYCQGWHPHNGSQSFVHSHSNSSNLPIVSSQLSYTTPIVPEGSNPRPPGVHVINGVLTKIELERGTPEGASSSSRVPMDSQYPLGHHLSQRDQGLIHRHPQAMNF